MKRFRLFMIFMMTTALIVLDENVNAQDNSDRRPVTVLRSRSSNQSNPNQSNVPWQYMGKVPLTKIDGNEWKSISRFGLLYAQFDGNSMKYKVYVADEDISYYVKANPSYDQNKVDFERKMNNKYDNWKGPHPKISERYPQCAGHWFLDVSDVFN